MATQVKSQVAVQRLGHVVLRVRDLERAEQFYTQVLGLKLMGRRRGRLVFFSADASSSHELAVMAAGPDAPGPERNRVGLVHVAWQVDSLEELEVFYQHLTERGLPVRCMDHGVSVGLYFQDPDGNEMECYYELPREQWDPKGPHEMWKFPHQVSFLPAEGPAPAAR